MYFYHNFKELIVSHLNTSCLFDLFDVLFYVLYFEARVKIDCAQLEGLLLFEIMCEIWHLKIVFFKFDLFLRHLVRRTKLSDLQRYGNVKFLSTLEMNFISISVRLQQIIHPYFLSK